MDEEDKKKEKEEKVKPKNKNHKFFSNLVQKFKTNLPAIKEKAFSTAGIVTGSSVIGLLFLVIIIVQSCTPHTGSIIYGICGAFLEQQVTFPETIKHSTVEQYRKAVRIYYTHIDGFGEYQLEMVECSFVQDPQKGVQLESAVFDRIRDITKRVPVRGKGRLFEVEKKYIDRFNEALSSAAIISQEPDLTLPKYPENIF